MELFYVYIGIINKLCTFRKKVKEVKQRLNQKLNVKLFNVLFQ